MKVNKFLKNIIISFLVALLLIPAFLLVNKPVEVKASEVASYTSALDDLSSTAEFSEADYPKVSNDFSIQVITIAESIDKELFIYVYQPSAYSVRLTASSINISLGTDENLSYINYKLEEISSEGVYQKYLVKDLVVSDEPVRHYNISSIFRPFDSVLDEGLPDYNENVVSEKAFAVSKVYTATTEENGNVTYTYTTTEVVVITDKYVGYIEYSNGFFLYTYSSCRSHYVAFSCDHDIDKLLEADVYFVSQKCYEDYYNFSGIEYKTDPEVEQYAYLTYKQKVTHEGQGWFSDYYEWDRIESVSDFISNENLTDEAKEDLANKEWVLRFYESEFSFGTASDLSSWHKYYTEVSDVTILRLKFLVGGELYNLGVIDSKQYQPPSEAPDNDEPMIDFDLFEGLDSLGSSNSGCGGCSDFNFRSLLIILIIVVALILLLPFLPWIIKFLWFVIKYTCKGVLYIIKYTCIGVYYVLASPYYLVKWIINRRE